MSRDASTKKILKTQIKGEANQYVSTLQADGQTQKQGWYIWEQEEMSDTCSRVRDKRDDGVNQIPLHRPHTEPDKWRHFSECFPEQITN